jgi:hypothetical protein
VTPNTFGVNPAIGGLAHAAAQNPFVASQLANQWAANPFTSAFGSTVTNPFTNPFANPYATQLASTGLGHTAFGSAFADPYATALVAQTFPFLHWGYSPFGWPQI